MSYLKLLILVFFVGVSYTNLYANNEQFIKKEQWSKFAKTYHYNDDSRNLDDKPAAKNNESSKDRKEVKEPSFSLPIFSGLPGVIYMFIVLIVIALIAVIIILLVSVFNKAGNKPVNSSNKVFRQSIYENIENADLENDLREALSSCEFKDAVRIKYLIVLRLLNKHKLILWRKEKTNGIYLREMIGQKEFGIFKNLTFCFERAWYGEIEITENEYFNMIPIFDQIHLLINTRE